MYRKYFKRTIDIVAASIALIILSPILLIAIIAIKCEGKGKAVFKQKRIGMGNKPFYIYKLRTMAIDEQGVNRVTKIGKFLRVTSIDELPQLVNIIKGEMSFIGPRPWIEEYTKYFSKKELRRLEVLPGLSGWAQVQGRNGMTIRQKLDADIFYVDNISAKLDVIIFFKTIGIVFKKTGASITEKGIQEELDELKSQYNETSIIDAEIVDTKVV